MSNIIKFKKIEKENIFCDDFKNLKENNIIDFTKKKIAVVYAPNGVGKTSLSKVLDCEKGTSFKLEYNKNSYTEKDKKLFHRISDQNGRNIIKGETEDFVLGDDIRREYELKKHINEEFKRVFQDVLGTLLKNEFNISKKDSPFLKNILTDEKIKEFIMLLINNRKKGEGIDYFEFINKIDKLNLLNEERYDEEKYKYFISDYGKSDSILKEIIELQGKNIVQNYRITEIKENDVAITVLEEYKDKHQCVVCDGDIIDPNVLLEHKKNNREKVYELLDDNTKSILEKIIEKVKDDDPFDVKVKLINAIKEGNKAYLEQIKDEINYFINIYKAKINNLFVTCLNKSDLKESCSKYKEMIEKPLSFTTEDVLYIEKVINENVRKNIILEREPDSHEIKIKIDNKDLLDTDREELNLSTGEQNFISLTFELLKARNVDEEIIIIDDPISSFDSIYKNKIAFTIIKFLENKKQIVLTHNTELIKLLEYQLQGCFNLYLLNNVPGELNGFVYINSEEQKLLLSLSELLKLFRHDIYDSIKDEKLFIISLIPFMRGYANIIEDFHVYKRLSKLMHGYEKGSINVTNIYNKLFKDKNGNRQSSGNTKKINNKYKLTVNSILSLNIEKCEIVDISKYPLLNRTLNHSLTYLYLRLYVEKNLTKLYIHGEIPENYMLAQIIRDSFKGNDKNCIEQRVFFNSRKTLLNEFNHFEGNMNIYQPAIDISDDSLQIEKQSIINRIEKLKREK